MNDRRRKLLRIMARIEQLMSEAEGITVGETDDEVLLRVAELSPNTGACWRMWIGS